MCAAAWEAVVPVEINRVNVRVAAARDTLMDTAMDLGLTVSPGSRSSARPAHFFLKKGEIMKHECQSCGFYGIDKEVLLVCPDCASIFITNEATEDDEPPPAPEKEPDGW